MIKSVKRVMIMEKWIDGLEVLLGWIAFAIGSLFNRRLALSATFLAIARALP